MDSPVKKTFILMEIDLELPLNQEDKLDAGLGTYTGDGTDGLHAGEEVVNSPRTGKDLRGNPGINVGENISKSGEGEDEDTLRLGAFGKEVKIHEPQKGLEFESKEAAYSFYREYARSVGFGITIKASRRSKKSGKFIDVKIACCRFGSNRESSTTVNSRSCTKTGCKASMQMKKRQDEKWFIYSFVKEHNHEICPDDFYYALRGKSKQSGICEKKGLQLALDEVDVQVLLEYCMDMQDENPHFFYAIDLDNEKRMRNVLWVEAKSRYDYSNFNDVVFFDSRYVSYNYKVPFIPILGVNHHFQLVLLGCALIGEETTSTFVWLLRTWLRVVGGRTPKVIITDEGESLEGAITEVFPAARHCFCLCHVMCKIAKNLGHKVNMSQNFLMTFSECIHRSWTIEEFEKKWWEMVDKFEFKDDEWVQALYRNRKKWVPVFMSDTLLAGMCTTEQCEGIALLFDKCMHKETSFKEFIDRYKAFLHDRYEEEARADFETHHKQPTLRSPSSFEKQMSTVYTDAVFKKFQIEVLGSVACSLQKECGDEAVAIFRVHDFEERQNFVVAWNEAYLHISCLCRSFEYRGFLCRHAMIVLQMSGISTIPSHYILQRWTKAAKVRESNSEITTKLHQRVQRFNDLCKRAIKLGEEGSLSKEAYNTVIYALQEAMERCVGVKNSRCVLEPNTLATQGFLTTEEENENVGKNLAKASKRNKTCKKRKVQSEGVVTISRMLDGNRQMGQLNSGAQSLDNTFVPEQDSREVGSKTAVVDGYNGSQQSLQGLGRLNSSSSVRDGYYSNQQGMQRLGQLKIPVHYGPPQSLQGLLQGQLSFRAPTTNGNFNIEECLHDME